MNDVVPAQESGRGGLPAFVLVAIGALLAVLVGGAGVFFGMTMSPGGEAAPQVTEAAPVTAAPVIDQAPATEEPDKVLENDELAERYGRSVFKVEVEGCQSTGWGTAWVLDDRHLVTNWHVVSIDPTPELVSRDGKDRLKGTVIGGHTEPDVAVIRVDEPLPDALPWADTGELREGQEIVSLGYPAPEGDFAVTPSTILSFQKRGATREAIRGDGALDRGNSGGPALTRDGKVAGVATVMVQEANQLQMVPLLFTTDALRRSVDRIVADPGEVEAECEPEFALLPDDWAPDFEDWSSEGPQNYGDDAALDALYDACATGDMAACDDLWISAPWGSEYEAFANSCGGSSDSGFGSCESQAEWAAQEAEWEAEQAEAEAAQAAAEAEAERQAAQEAEAAQAALDALVGECEAGDMQACDDLGWEADYGSDEYDVADTCGGHYPDGWGSCVDRETEAAELQVLVGECEAGDMEACDDLFWSATTGTPEQSVAEDCGGAYPGGGGMCAYYEETG